jgi:hypothetical protein
MKAKGPTSTDQNATTALREKLIASLSAQGFNVESGFRLSRHEAADKDGIRRLHSTSVSHRRDQSRPSLGRYENDLLKMIASGNEVDPLNVQPRLVEVLPGSIDELLFRYARLHWSIPVSAGYGRRLRFVVYDQNNSKLMGVIGLGDPVFNLAPRDTWIGWNSSQRKDKLKHTMDAFALGAVPPYSYLLCGKFMAMLLTSNEARKAFANKYGGRSSYIAEQATDGRLAMVTTTSALGRSSLYNRVRFNQRQLLIGVGFTKGSGEFHFSNDLYRELRQFAEANCEATAKHSRWGKGFRNRRELLRKVLPKLGLPSDLVYHGIRREVFAVPLAENTQAFLRGEQNNLLTFNHTSADLFSFFRDRWMIPRSQRDKRYLDFDARDYRLWD